MRVYCVVTIERGTLAVKRIDGEESKTLFVTTDSIAAYIVRGLLHEADRRSFYEGLVVGHSERDARRDLMASAR